MFCLYCQLIEALPGCMLTIPAKEAGRRSSLLSCPIPIAQLSSRPPDVALSLCPHSKWSRRHPISSTLCLSTQTQKHSLETHQPQWPGNQIGYEYLHFSSCPPMPIPQSYPYLCSRLPAVAPSFSSSPSQGSTLILVVYPD